MLAESSLCAIDQTGELIRDGASHPALDCMCGNILCGRFNPAKPFFTAQGSFWSSCTTDLLANTTEADRQAKTRNRCNGDGYESVALVPLRIHGETYGLFQFNDKRRDRFTNEKITFLESLVDYVAIALAKIKTDEALRESENRYELILNSAGEGIYGLDVGSNVTFMNEAGAKLLGWEVKNILGKNSLTTWHHTKADGKSYPDEECGLKELLKSGVGKVGIEDWFWKKDGTGFPVEYTNNPLYKEGALIGAVVTFKDITERKQSLDNFRKALGSTVQAIASVVETRDPYTAGHQRRVADLARAIAVDLDLTTDQTDGLRMASLIHDIGKISVPAEILSKPTKLSDIEFSLIKSHAQAGYDVLKDIEFPWPIARIVREHHERIDGTGYPHGLTGEKFLLESKILAVADVVEAIASHRPYRPTLGIDVALKEIEKNRGILYDNAVVDACLRLFQEKGFQLAVTSGVIGSS